MKYTYKLLPEKIKRQIITLTKYCTLPFNEDSIEKIARLWFKKEEIFKAELEKNNMIETEYIELTNKNGAVILTYSGSLLKISPENNTKRKVEYTSIGLRRDVPDNLIIEDTTLAYDIIKDEPTHFEGGRLKTTSPVYKIGICSDSKNIKEQSQTIDKVTDYILNNFIELNREYLDEKEIIWKLL